MGQFDLLTYHTSKDTVFAVIQQVLNLPPYLIY